MIKRKLTAIAAAAGCVAVAFTGCTASAPVNSGKVSIGGEVNLLEGVELDYENAFFDDFIGGVDYDTWYIGKQAWGVSGNGNGGVIPENVNYTDDGVLVLSGNGNYYTAGDVRGIGTAAHADGTLTGAAIISKFVTAPGRYEVKMKVMPRLGACSAMWVYAYDGATNGNHEIDIELPGGSGTGNISFEQVLNTNYITEEAKDSTNVPLADADLDVVLNDGQWHTFGFDWYTLESGEDVSRFGEDTNLGKVVYYLDGKVTAISDVFVPFYTTRLWLGVWFPNNSGFVGDANFETDYMYVDWVSYIPFKNQPAVQFVPDVGASQVASRNEYPTVPVSLADVNKVSNGNFEYAASGKTNSGWQSTVRTLTSEESKNLTAEEKESLLEASVCAVKDGAGVLQSYGVTVEKRGMLYQEIDSVYGGFNLNLGFSAKGKGKVNILFYGQGSELISMETVEIDGINWAEFSKNYVAPDGTKHVEIQLISDLYTAVFADDFSLKVN